MVEQRLHYSPEAASSLSTLLGDGGDVLAGRKSWPARDGEEVEALRIIKVAY